MTTRLSTLILVSLAVLLSAACVPGGHAAHAAPRKVALVVGIDDYQSVQKLTRARNDATAVGRRLELLGFDVILRTDADRRAVSEAMTQFEEQLRGAEIGLFFFAGHGVELRGTNILLPADMPATLSESVALREGLLMSDVAQLMSGAGVKYPVLIIDACRDNPLPQTAGRSVGRVRGLGRADVPLGTYVVYSAGIGETALDRLSDDDASSNSVFTRNLLPALEETGVSLDAAVKQVRERVRVAAAGVNHQQNPAIYDQATGELFLMPRPAAPAAPPPTITMAPDGSGMEALFWQSVQASNRPSELEAYLSRYPDGVFAPLARTRLEALTRPSSPTTAAATPTPARPQAAPPPPPSAVASLALPEPAGAPSAGLSIADAVPIRDRERIREAQQRLAQLGLDPGPANGVLTPRTRTAVRAFEAASGRPSAGDLTGAVLDRLRAGPPPAPAELANALFAQAHAARDSRASAEAIRLYEAGLRLSPRDPQASLALADLRRAMTEQAAQARQQQAQRLASREPAAGRTGTPDRQGDAGAAAAPFPTFSPPPAATPRTAGTGGGACGVSFAGSRNDAGLAGYTFANSCGTDMAYRVRCASNSNIGRGDLTLRARSSTTVWVAAGRGADPGGCTVLSSRPTG